MYAIHLLCLTIVNICNSLGYGHGVYRKLGYFLFGLCPRCFAMTFSRWSARLVQLNRGKPKLFVIDFIFHSTFCPILAQSMRIFRLVYKTELATDIHHASTCSLPLSLCPSPFLSFLVLHTQTQRQSNGHKHVMFVLSLLLVAHPFSIYTHNTYERSDVSLKYMV